MRNTIHNLFVCFEDAPKIGRVYSLWLMAYGLWLMAYGFEYTTMIFNSH